MWIDIKEPYTLLALLSAVPGAYLAFKRSFARDIRDQMIDLRNPGGVGTNTVPLFYQILARLYVGEKGKWLELFNPTSEEYQRLFSSDKTSGVRVFVWFSLVIIFSFVSWLFD